MEFVLLLYFIGVILFTLNRVLLFILKQWSCILILYWSCVISVIFIYIQWSCNKLQYIILQLHNYINTVKFRYTGPLYTGLLGRPGHQGYPLQNCYAIACKCIAEFVSAE